MITFTNKKNKLCVSRASTAIFLILKENDIYGKNVLVPANICYAAVYPIIYSGNYPIFCDISDGYGNISLNTVLEYEDIAAAIIPHMYGNPVTDILSISRYFKAHNILFIEDCASSLGGTVSDRMCGDFGDYSIFSTGYSKTIDVGAGGIICSDRDLGGIDLAQKKLHLKDVSDDTTEAFFSKLYRLIRNSEPLGLKEEIWNCLKFRMQDVFINYIPDIEKTIMPKIADWQEIVKLRREKYSLYYSSIQENNLIEPIRITEGASPWRFSMLIRPDLHRHFIDHLLSMNIPVSDWYPNVTSVFGCHNDFKNVDTMEDMIVNLPLMTEDSIIISICNTINNYIASVGRQDLQ